MTQFGKIFIPGIMAAVFLGAVFFPPNAVFACSCVADISQKDSFNQAKAVFSGKVLSIQDKGRISAAIQVEETWKGATAGVVTVATGRDDGDCGFDFQTGEKYLVYAYDASRDYQAGLGTNICQRTKLLAQADEDLKMLGPGGTLLKKPAGPLLDEYGAYNALWSAALLILAVVMFAYILVRRFIRK